MNSTEIDFKPIQANLKSPKCAILLCASRVRLRLGETGRDPAGLRQVTAAGFERALARVSSHFVPFRLARGQPVLDVACRIGQAARRSEAVIPAPSRVGFSFLQRLQSYPWTRRP